MWCEWTNWREARDEDRAWWIWPKQWWGETLGCVSRGCSERDQSRTLVWCLRDIVNWRWQSERWRKTMCQFCKSGKQWVWESHKGTRQNICRCETFHLWHLWKIIKLFVGTHTQDLTLVTPVDNHSYGPVHSKCIQEHTLMWNRSFVISVVKCMFFRVYWNST